MARLLILMSLKALGISFIINKEEWISLLNPGVCLF